MSKASPFLIGQSEPREIDGETYTVTQFPASKNLRLWTRIVRLLGEPLGALVQGAVAAGGLALSAAVDIQGAVKALAEKLEPLEFESLVRDLLSGTFVKGVGPDGNVVAKDVADVFDGLFAGRMTTLFKVLAFVMEENYADFFAQFAKVAAGQPATPPA